MCADVRKKVCFRLWPGAINSSPAALLAIMVQYLLIRRVTHTVNPKYAVKYHTTVENALSHCYQSCLELLIENELQSIATSCIYTEAKNYPRKPAAHVAISGPACFRGVGSGEISKIRSTSGMGYGPWFLSIFVNMLPWESVLRVWDVLLFDGNRVMIFLTALALMQLYGPALVTTRDAGDAVTLLQSLAGSTFDNSQLVLTACMGYQAVNDVKLQELRNKHRPAVIAAIEERCKGLRAFRDSQGLASKLYSFKHDPESLIAEKVPKEGLAAAHGNGTDVDGFPSLTEGVELDPDLDFKEQIYAVSITIRIVVCSLTLVNLAYTLLVLNYSSAPLCQLCFFFRVCNIINPARPVKLKV